MNDNLSALVENVRDNCHIADALHASNYTLCIYLLKMRELYRWESGQGFNHRIDHHALGDWLSAREALWDSLANSSFKPLTIEQRQFDPLDSSSINAALLPLGLVYSAGYGSCANPHFFLARLENMHREGDFTIYICREELARDLTAPPAMAHGQHIFIRRESLRRMIWEKYEEWLWNKPDNAMRRVVDYYAFDTDINAALEKMTDRELEMALLHEIGEVKSSQLLGEQWLEILAELPRSRGEIVFRAVKDHLADSMITLPSLMENFYPQSLHFYMANLSNMRKTMTPQLQQIYLQWCESGDLNPLKHYIKKAKSHWLAVAQEILALRTQCDDIKAYAEAVNERVEKNYL